MPSTHRRPGRGPARPSHAPSAGRRRRGSRGATAVEYGLLVAAICAVICIGVGVTLKTVLSQTVTCFIEEVQGTAATDASCQTSGSGGGGGGGGAGGGGGGGIGTVTPSASASPSVSPTPSPTTTP